VASDCSDEAKANKEAYGVWGGETGRLRRKDRGAELRRKLIFAQHRRYLSEEPVTLPRVAWLERPDITAGW
jgi:hypothetical protein